MRLFISSKEILRHFAKKAIGPGLEENGMSSGLKKDKFAYDNNQILKYMINKCNAGERKDKEMISNTTTEKCIRILVFPRKYIPLPGDINRTGIRFKEIDENAEYNQLKVIKAMQDNKVSEACLLGTTGYGYNDLGRETLEAVYASIFHTEDALVRPLDYLRYSCTGTGIDE